MNLKALLTCALAATALCAQAEAPYTYSVGDQIEINNKVYKVTGKNLVTNPYFENGLTGWTSGASGNPALDEANFEIVTDGVPDSGKALSSKADGGSGSAQAVVTSTLLEKGKTYFISLWSKTGSVNCRVRYSTTKNDVNNGTLLVTTSDFTSSEWKHHTRITTSDTSVNSYIVFQYAWLNKNGQFAWHNVVEVEELSAFEQAVAMAAKFTKENYPLAADDKFTALANACNATESDENAAVITNACRAIVESDAIAENVKGRVDATNYITNPIPANTATRWTKENEILDGWCLSLLNGNANMRVQTGEAPTFSNGTTPAYYDTDNWNQNDWTSAFSQKIALPAGKYRLALAARGATSLGYYQLAAGNTTIDMQHHDGADGIYGRGWEENILDFETYGDEIQISVKGRGNGTGRWESFTNFRLTKIGEADFQTENAQKAIEEAQNLIGNTVSGSAEGQYPADLRTTLEKALSDAKTALQNTNGKTFDKDLQTALDNATSALNEAIAAYSAAKILVVADKWYFIKNTAANRYWFAMEVAEDGGVTQMRIRLSDTNPEVMPTADALPQDANNDHKFKFSPVEGENGHFTIHNAAELVLNTEHGWITYAYPDAEKASAFGLEEADGKLIVATLKQKDGHACYMAPDNFDAATGVYSDKDRATALEKGPVELVAVPADLLPSGIENVAADTLPGDNTVYDLYGRRVANPAPGIYIVNGKKTVIR